MNRHNSTNTTNKECLANHALGHMTKTLWYYHGPGHISTRLLLRTKPNLRAHVMEAPAMESVITIAETYVACLEQPAHPLMWGLIDALIDALNFVGLGINVGIKFAKNHHPKPHSTCQLMHNSKNG
jgi:hypothetical protein